MFKDTDLQISFKKSINQIKVEAEELKKIYDSFFDFNIILTSDTGSKTALNRDYIYESNQILKENTSIINATFDEMFLSFKKFIMQNIPKDTKEEIIITTFVFDNEEFLNKVKKSAIDKQTLKAIENILYIKDKLYDLKYVISNSNTLSVSKRLNKLTVNELQDSKTIFSIIDHLGILTNSFYDFYNRIQKFEENYIDEVDLDLNFLNSFIISESIKLSEFIYHNKKHKFFLDFNNQSKVSKKYYLDRVYIENILSSLIEQGCLDIIHKERYSTKSDRVIKINSFIEKKTMIISCEFDGLYNKNFDDEIALDDHERNLILAKNLLYYVDGKLEMGSKGSMVEYKITVNLNKSLKANEPTQ